jgi:hypothetical protein
MIARVTLLLHIAAGAVGLVSGFVALYSAKGAPLHRRVGTAFVYAMLTMCAAGLAIAVGRGVAPAINVPAAVITASLVITALTTVRPPSAASRALDRAATIACLGVGVGTAAYAIAALAGGARRGAAPAIPFLMFGVVGLLAAAGDVRVMRGGALTGARRLARHLWRMSFALFIAALSFFVGQAKVIPEPLRVRPLLALPVLAVLATMLYWLWRVRVRQSFRGVVRVTAPGAALGAR